MNNIKVKPILLPTKDKHSQLEIDDLSVGKLSYESKRYQCKKPMQFVLISLEDAKIEVGDLFLADDRDYVMNNPIYSIQKCKKIENEWIFGNDLDLGYNSDWSEKVIATQEQLSPELIQQLIAEYNNSCMQDFEIEMEYTLGNEEDQNQNLIPVLIPKLTNGFVTIVEKSDDLIKFLKERINKASSTETQAAYTIVLAEYNKKILYTEEEVKDFLGRFGHYIMTHPDLDMGEEFEEAIYWFNQNKKK